MTKNLIQQLKPFVSAFSAEIPLKFTHKDVVTIGGQVKSILNLAHLLETSFDKELREEGIYVTIDDGVGETNIVIAPPALDIYEKHHGPLHIDDVIVAEGRVFRLDTTHTYQGAQGKRITTDNHKYENLRVLVYQLAPVAPQKTVVKKVQKQEE